MVEGFNALGRGFLTGGVFEYCELLLLRISLSRCMYSFKSLLVWKLALSKSLS
jgi:hypothetical protein